MKYKQLFRTALTGAAAGAVTGALGAGGGMILVPLLGKLSSLDEDAVFPASVCIILPVCAMSLLIRWRSGPLPWGESLPYLVGSCIGGLLAWKLGSKIPASLLHKLLGVLILWGGIRCLL